MEERLTSSLDRDDDVNVAASGVAVSALQRQHATAAAHNNRSRPQLTGRFHARRRRSFGRRPARGA